MNEGKKKLKLSRWAHSFSWIQLFQFQSQNENENERKPRFPPAILTSIPQGCRERMVHRCGMNGSLGTKQLLTARWRTLGFPMRLFSLLSVNKIWILFLLSVWHKYFIYVFVSLCVPVSKTILRSSQCKGECAPLSMRLLWSRGAWGSFTCRRSHQFFSSMPCTQTKFWQWTSRFKATLHSVLLLSEKLQPGIILK